MDAVVGYSARHVTLLVLGDAPATPELRVLFDMPEGALTAQDVQVSLWHAVRHGLASGPRVTMRASVCVVGVYCGSWTACTTLR